MSGLILLATLLLGTAPMHVLAAPPNVEVLINGNLFHGGEPFQLGYAVRNPRAAAAAEFYVGVVTPDGSIVVFPAKPGGALGGELDHGLSAFLSGRDSSSGRVRALPQAAPTLLVPPGFVQIEPALFQAPFPPSGIPSGQYQFFAVLVEAGALQDGQLSPSEILAVSIQPMTFAPIEELDPAVRARIHRFRSACEDEVVQLVDKILSELFGVGFKIFYQEYLASLKPHLQIVFGSPLVVPVGLTKTFYADPFGLPVFHISPPGPTRFCDDIPFEIAELEVVLSSAETAKKLTINHPEVVRLRADEILPLTEDRLTMSIELEGLQKGTALLEGRVEFTQVFVKIKTRIPPLTFDIFTPLTQRMAVAISKETFDIQELVIVEDRRVFRGPVSAAGSSPTFDCGIPGLPNPCFFVTSTQGTLELNLGNGTYRLLPGTACLQTLFSDRVPPLPANCSQAIIGFPGSLQVLGGASFVGALAAPYPGNPNFKLNSVIGEIRDDVAMGVFTAEPLGDCRPVAGGPCGAVGSFSLPRVEDGPPIATTADATP